MADDPNEFIEDEPPSEQEQPVRISAIVAPNDGAGSKSFLVEDVPPPPGAGIPPQFPTDKWRETTRAALAGSLTLILAVIVLGTFVFVGVDFLEATEAETLLCAMLSPVVGLVGAATGFYYGGADRRH